VGHLAFSFPSIGCKKKKKKNSATSLASSNSTYLTLAPVLACCDNHTIEGGFPVKIQEAA